MEELSKKAGSVSGYLALAAAILFSMMLFEVIDAPQEFLAGFIDAFN